jgi:cell division GTPase
MLSVGIIGVGNAGSQVATLAAQNNIKSVVINSSENDLSVIPDTVTKFLVGDSRGAGKNRDAAKGFLKSSITGILNKEEFIDFMDGNDVVFVISSTGGGTGSGIAPIMTEILSQAFPDSYIILVGILPTLNEAYSTQVNTVAFVKELYEKINKPTYMLYDNEKMSSEPSHVMMESINQSIIEDILVLVGKYNYPTKYSSIDEKDMSMIISTPGRLVVSRLTNFKEKDLDQSGIDSRIENILKTNTHAELQRDKVIKRSGVIANLNESIASKFDDHMTSLQKFIGVPVEEFTHISINTEKALPNNVFFIGSGLSPVFDRLTKINERIEEIDAIQNDSDSISDALSSVDISKANEKKGYREKRESDEPLALSDIFKNFS